jgi:hypothetical protein
LQGTKSFVLARKQDLKCGFAVQIHPLEDAKSLFEPAGDSYLVHNFQGVDSFEFYGREHLVYFPNRSALKVGSETSFVPSYTSPDSHALNRT